MTNPSRPVNKKDSKHRDGASIIGRNAKCGRFTSNDPCPPCDKSAWRSKGVTSEDDPPRPTRRK